MLFRSEAPIAAPKRKKRSMIANNYVYHSRLQTQMYPGSDQYFSYGFLPIHVEPDWESGMPRIRVEDPMLSIVAIRRKLNKRSGASVPSARQAPLNSSISDMIPRISGVIWMVVALRKEPLISKYTPIYTHLHRAVRLPIRPIPTSLRRSLQSGFEPASVR